MVAFLQFYAFIFACCFAWQVGRPSSWSQKVTRAFLISINSLFIFFRASVSIFLLIGPLLLVSYVLFPNLLYFAGPLSIIISILVIGLLDRLVSFVILPIIRSFFLKKKPDDAAITGSHPLYMLDGCAPVREFDSRTRRTD